MALSSEEDNFLEAAVAAIPKISELIAAMAAEDRAEALDTAERRFLQTAEDVGCTGPAARDWTNAVMRILQDRVKEHESAKHKLKKLYDELSAEAADYAQPSIGVTAERSGVVAHIVRSELFQAMRAFFKMAFQADDPGQR